MKDLSIMNTPIIEEEPPTQRKSRKAIIKTEDIGEPKKVPVKTKILTKKSKKNITIAANAYGTKSKAVKKSPIPALDDFKDDGLQVKIDIMKFEIYFPSTFNS